MILRKTPLITIAITCFNAEKTIERAILSALNQDWPNFEIIIVDDASKDSSKEIIYQYESKIKNLQYKTLCIRPDDKKVHGHIFKVFWSLDEVFGDLRIHVRPYVRPYVRACVCHAVARKPFITFF